MLSTVTTDDVTKIPSFKVIRMSYITHSYYNYQETTEFSLAGHNVRMSTIPEGFYTMEVVVPKLLTQKRKLESLELLE